MFYWFNKTKTGYWIMKVEQDLSEWPDVAGTAEIGLGYKAQVLQDFLKEVEDYPVVYTEDNPLFNAWEVEQQDSDLDDEQMTKRFGPKPEEFVNYELRNV